MKCLKRNKVPFWYALYAGKVPMTDEYGNETGEFQMVYGKPLKGYANISAAVGETESRQFGEPEEYDKVMAMDLDTKIDEYSILWIDTEPIFDEKGETSTPNDYIVKKVAKSLNSVSFAIKKVTVNG